MPSVIQTGSIKPLSKSTHWSSRRDLLTSASSSNGKDRRVLAASLAKRKLLRAWRNSKQA